MHKIYSLPLVLLLLTACSTKESPNSIALASPQIKKTSKEIVALQPIKKTVKKVQTKALPKISIGAEIIKTPILTNGVNPYIKTEVKSLPPTIVVKNFTQPIIQSPIVAMNQKPMEKEIEEQSESLSYTEMEEEPIFQEPILQVPIEQEAIIVQSQVSSPVIEEDRYQTPQHESQNQNSGFQNEIQGEFQGNYKLMSFIDRMVNEQGFDRNYLYQVFSEAQNINNFVRPYRTPSSTYISGAWDRYKSNFIYERNIQRGIKFWTKHRATLDRATAEYGVPAKYIVGIIGIETAYGVNFGKKKVLDVLTTKAMIPNRRQNFYTKQLEKFLVMTRKANLNPTELMGSNAGAMGYGQFIASSYLDFAVDFNGDGKIDLWDAEDAIGSIANYFARNGWRSSIGQVAIRAKYRGNRFRKRLKTGYKTKYSQYKLRKKYKIKSRKKMSYSGPVSLIKLNRAEHDEIWFGTHNFRVLTTYNHSTHYGMAVFQLGEEVKKRRGGYLSSL